MIEKKSAVKKQKEKEKDFFSFVIVCQFFICLALVGVIFFASSMKGDFGVGVRECVLKILTQSSSAEQLSSAAEAVKEFFAGESLAVFGSGVTDALTDGNAAVEETTSQLPMGGEDLEVFEAAEKTSFAPYVTTDSFINPIENGRYTSYFGYRTNPITGRWSFHTGLDIGAAQGEKIRCALSGTVTAVGEDSRAGKYIIVTHSQGFQTFYCHCSEILAEKGMKLNKGETLALVGSTGNSTGPHLHFEVRCNGIRLNPLLALQNDS